MNLLTVYKIKKMFGDTLLFDDVTFEVRENDKIGLVGINGAGKTSLFKILLDEMDADGGEISKNKLTAIGYMEQNADYSSTGTLWEELMTVYSNVTEVEKRLENINTQLEQNPEKAEELIRRQHSLHEEFERLGGYTYKSIARSSLKGVGFDESEFDIPFEKLSGGQKTRLLLCKILLGSSNLLFLDEPTNHLDIKAVEWLENFLKEYRGAFIVISHDRYFLDKVTGRTMELENEKLTVYEGNYSRYLQLKEEANIAKERQYENKQKEIKRLEGIITQQRQWNRERNIKMAESKQKVLDKLESTLEKPDNKPEEIDFKFASAPFGSNDVLTCTDLAMSFGTKNLFENLDLEIKKQDRMFLLGPNGCGKTTLFKIILSRLDQTRGIVKHGTNIKIAYYDQAQEDLNPEKTVFEEVHDAYPKMSQTEVRSSLAVFLFKGEDVFKKVGDLSGGEKARVLLLKLMLSGAGFLLLDEPTNHLDISSREALENALKLYNGTLLIISHDRYFINKLADKIVYMTENSLKKYDGNYDNFLERYLNENTQTETQKPQTSQNDYKMRKQLEAEKRKRASQIKKYEDEIREKEDIQTALRAKLELEEYATDHVKAAEIYIKIEEIENELLELYEDLEKMGEDL